MKKIIKYFVIVFLLFFALACNNKPNLAQNQNTPTTGEITIAVDQSFSLLLDTEIYTFESIYNYAKIKPLYLPEQEVFDLFMKDSIQLIFTTRKLSKNEETYLNEHKHFPTTTHVAWDALGIIVNKNNKDTLLKYYQVRDIISGEIENWNQVNKKSGLGKIKLVFDNIKSGNVRYFDERYELKGKFSTNCFVAESNEEVINYVEKNSNAIGIISVNWISDKHDSTSLAFLNRIKVVAISSEFNSDGSDYYRPYQAYIADKSYPFIREVYMINRETYIGLSSGFTNFVAGDVGQRIILKSRLLPATMPIRVVKFRKNY